MSIKGRLGSYVLPKTNADLRVLTALRIIPKVKDKKRRKLAIMFTVITPREQCFCEHTACMLGRERSTLYIFFCTY